MFIFEGSWVLILKAPGSSIVRYLGVHFELLRGLRQALGRMVFIYGSLPSGKPFLAPLFSFLSHGEPGACLELPLYVRSCMTWLSSIQARRAYPCGIARTQRGSILRVDAKAEGRSIGIGAWLLAYGPGGGIAVASSKWCAALELDESSAPWAFHQGEPYKAISDL